MEEKEYSVSEAVKQIKVPSHVLRYWEEELQIKINRTSQGHRIYSEADIAMFCRVRDLKEKGLQLKAIRVLLEQSDGEASDADFARQIRSISEPAQAEKTEQEVFDDDCSETQEEFPVYEIVTSNSQKDHLEQFEGILRNLISEVIAEQNEKLEKAIVADFRSELEELYLQYYQMMQEAASARDRENRRRGWLESLRELFAGRR